MSYTTNKSNNKLIPPHGGYKKLESYKTAVIIYDGTVKFTELYLYKSHKTYKSYTRTIDQMVQAARSGKQNIVEGSIDSGTSKKVELKLIGIARGSFGELLEDFEDFLRQNNLPLWDKDSKRATAIRKLAYRKNKSYTTYETYMGSAESAANMMLCIIHQANYLLNRQLRTLEKDFLEEGGFTERLYSSRQRARANESSRKEAS